MPKDVNPTPEQKARQKINKMFRASGWEVVPRSKYSPAVSAVAIEEGLLQGNLEADYLLFLGGRAIGVLEAKKESASLSDIVANQAEKYTHKLLDWYQAWETPLPLIYLSNGKELFFKNLKTPEPGYIPLLRMDTPAEMAKRAGVTSAFIGLPALSPSGLRSCQYDAITELEASFRTGQKRALIVLATGAGKTFTACLAAYRLLTYTPTRRILFLVDRNNLGKQAEGEFGKFKLTESAEPFNTIYLTERLESSTVSKGSNLVICTIQRLFSVITGQELQEDENDDLPKEISGEPDVELTTDKLIPPDFFDAIIVDECHRSIYGRWKKVLEYFNDALIIGLTATPAGETMKFFNNNRVINYTLERSIADGINVDGRIYRIKTQATENGGEIKQGDNYVEITKYTGQSVHEKASAEEAYAAGDLDRAVVNPAQIKLVLATYRDAVYTEFYPERDANLAYIPKTLVFAKDEAHARNIVRIIREEVFPGQCADFVQQITYSVGNSHELIRSFRNNASFRIAVTVTLVATGTDVKPLEVLIFMRDLNSKSLYIQMKGRGVRTIGDEQLRNVTPNAISKDLFYLIDAIGVTEHAWNEGQGGGAGGVNITLEK
jgi:type I restriction enzyme R subunit